MQFFSRVGQLLCAYPEDKEFRLQVGASTEDNLVAVREELDIEWDYSTVDEEE